jgi:hypothetical protein
LHILAQHLRAGSARRERFPTAPMLDGLLKLKFNPRFFWQFPKYLFLPVVLEGILRALLGLFFLLNIHIEIK